MIYIHFEQLSCIMVNCNIVSADEMKERIHAYRHQMLSSFAKRQQLAVPTYDKLAGGKPIITNSHLVFNQSHHDTAYVLVWSLDVDELGVDIECVNRTVKFESLARRYFHADEYRLWQDSGCDVRLWFRIWTIKEAVLKANGLGIRLTLSELNAKFTNANQGEIYHEKIGHYRFECIDVGDDVVTIAYAGDEWQAWCIDN
ncbi:MAG: 4'-phosphopantetheinyl transferase superfamily protein [Moraxella sp.]|nr:4'-phosphopantetheinyl transferase superfamily protein [Moraxella sp.]